MPIKVTVCVFCNREVTKKSTLDLGVLDKTKRGRACRAHPEVQELLARAKLLSEADEIRQKKVEEERAAWQKAERAMKVLEGSALARVLHTVHGMPVDTIYARLRFIGYSADVIEEVKAEVERRGGPKMTSEEIQTSALSYLELQRRVVNRAS